MAETTFRLGGLPWKGSEESAADALRAGGQAITPEQAVQAQQAQNDLSYVDQNWGVGGKFAAGVGSGLTLGLGPGIAAQAGLVDPGHLQAAQTSPWYTGGDVAGTVLPALLSGGEGVAGRSAIGKALSYGTPAGWLNTGGSLAERLTGNVLGEEAGVLGRMAITPAKMAARGAFEGAAINLGHTVGDALIQNKPLAAESLWASGVDGALAGGLLGGSIGTVGSIGSHAVESLGQLGKKAVGRAGVREGLAFRGLGIEPDEVRAIGNSYPGGKKAWLSTAHDVMSDGGVKLTDSSEKFHSGMVSAQDVSKKAINDVVTQLDAQAPTATPDIGRLYKRFDAVEAQYVGSVEHAQVQSLINGAKNDLDNVLYKRGKTGFVTDPNGERIPRQQSWGDWLKSRDQLAGRIDDFLKKSPDTNPLLNFKQQIKAQILDQLDGEIASSMEAVDQSAANTYKAAHAKLEIARQLDESVGNRATKELMSTQPMITGRDAAFAAVGALTGHPVASLGLLASKGVFRSLQQRLEPAIAQMAFDASIGTKAVGATQHVQGRIASSLSNFFKGASKSPTRAAMTAKQRSSETLTRAKYEDMASRTEQLLSSNHQAKVQQYAESLHDMGYQDFANNLMQTNNNAVQYLIHAGIPRQSAKALNSLKPRVVSKVPSLEEYKYYRKVSYITQPFKILDDLEAGRVSRDGVQAFKYVYPEFHGQIVQKAFEKVAEMKQAGDFLPMSKIVNLGIALDAPLDHTLTSEYIQPVQMALNTPAQPGPPPKQPPPGSSGDVSESLMTPLQKLAQGHG